FMCRFNTQGLDTFMADKAPRICQASLDVFALEPRIALQKFVGSGARRQHPQDMFDCQPPAPDNRLPAEYLGIYRDPFQQFLFVHFIPWLLIKAWTGLIVPHSQATVEEAFNLFGRRKVARRTETTKNAKPTK